MEIQCLVEKSAFFNSKKGQLIFPSISQTLKGLEGKSHFRLGDVCRGTWDKNSALISPFAPLIAKFGNRTVHTQRLLKSWDWDDKTHTAVTHILAQGLKRPKMTSLKHPNQSTTQLLKALKFSKSLFKIIKEIKEIF